MKLHLITYGCGKQFDPAKFKPVKNKSFGNLSHNFKFHFDGNVFVIDSCTDAARMPWITFYLSIKYPDFEKMVSLGYDAIWLTENGQQETRFGEPSLYGWDCESVLVMNPSGVLTTACTGQRGFSPSTSLVSG